MEGNLHILEQLIDCVVEMELPIISLSLKKQKVKSFCMKKYGNTIKIDPYLIAFPYITYCFNYYVKSKNSNGIIFLDEQSSLISNIDSVMNGLKSISCKKMEEIKVTNIIEKALFLKSSHSNFVQIADLCNFYINRFETEVFSNKHSKNIRTEHVRQMYQKLKPLIVADMKNPANRVKL